MFRGWDIEDESQIKYINVDENSLGNILDFNVHLYWIE